MTTSIVTWLIPSLITIIVCVVLYILLARRLRTFEHNQAQQPALTLLNQNVQGMHQLISEVSRELGSMQEIGRQMNDLQQFLKSPKLRGNIGEQVLHDLLRQHFPQALFEMQYKFRTGQIVDAVLKTDNGLIGIDSKFPLDNFDQMMVAKTDSAMEAARKLFFRDVKKHITDVAKKYILPEEGTVNFAVLYVPSEAIYYEMIREYTTVASFAYEQKVLLVSPNSFYYYLRVIMIGMQGKKIEQQAQRILASLEGLTKDAQKIGNELGVLNTHLGNAAGAMDRVNVEYSRLNAKLDQVKLLQ